MYKILTLSGKTQIIRTTDAAIISKIEACIASCAVDGEGRSVITDADDDRRLITLFQADE